MAETKSIAALGTSPEANQKLYDDWSQKYEADVREWGYDAPEQVSQGRGGNLRVSAIIF